MPVLAPPDWIACAQCRHRDGVGFVGHDDDDAAFMTAFKLGRGTLQAGANIEGDAGQPILLTLYSGWALRLRQGAATGAAILGIALPGDLIGLETVFIGRGALRLQALTDITYCQFDPARWRELLDRPALAERVLRAQALARREAEERQVAATTLSATGNLCHFVLTLHDALRRRKLARDDSFHLPLNRKQLAGALGLTALHLRRVLANLRETGVLELSDGRATLHDLSRLRRLAGNPQFEQDALPLI
ncbi:Crp/Fnr family transcriptional regulator [Sphingomonas sp. AR_OL41]|uniref:Crp/Fnr family transcriptional regulator n=1 Tax=Sphingomonas sp. AR_OL41 TaxID=3042729 RepID=UPI0024817A87|nr:Crp/Fnr family transcriptional regulator [Sphingomonas sp. AR_OL41]MDH7974187.1 Crp/Fnr family transcriptional regulator [Sphingomonas sp. AR_OL41]